jgi:low temperature requirement protein LtrA
MIGSGTFRLEPPRLRTTEDASSERHATWYELFDLVFAAAVVELSTGLGDDPTSAVFGRFAALFVAISWAWTGFAVYANRFDTDDLIYRLIEAGAAFATAAIAIEIPRLLAGDGGSMAFAIGYAVVRLLLVALYVRARLHVRGEGRRLVDIYIVTFTFTACLWLASTLLPAPSRFLVWGLALGLDLCVPPFAWRTLGPSPIVCLTSPSASAGSSSSCSVSRLRRSSPRLPASSSASRPGCSPEPASSPRSACGGSTSTSRTPRWWAAEPSGSSVYGHFPLYPGIAAFAAGATLAITHVDQPGLEAGARWALAGGLVAFALALAVLHLGAEWTSMQDRSFLGRLVLIMLLGGLAAFGGALSPLVFVLLLTAGVLGQLLLEAFTFPTGAASVLEPPEPALESGGG